MSEDGLTQAPTVFSSKERAALVAKALSEAARRARFSTKKRRSQTAGGFRARRGERLIKLIRLWSFVGVVVVPFVVAAIYLGFIASDQYTAEARFTVRGGLPPPIDSMGALTGAPSMLIIQDTQIIMNFMQSRAMVEALDRSVGMKRLYQNADIDLFSRLKKTASIENVVKYWKRHMSLEVQMPAGIVVFTVKAFSADDAVRIADAALETSEKLVNDMNASMLSDAVHITQAEREHAQANLAVARTDLEKARNQEGMLSADATSKALTGLMTSVRQQMIEAQEAYSAQRRFVSADAPQMRNLQTRIDAAKQEIDKLQAQMTQGAPSPDGDPGDAAATDGSSKVLAGSMSRLDYATLNNAIADKIYAGSLVALEQARIASELKMMYINTFIRPVAADQARYPMRGFDMGMVLAIGLVTWGAILIALRLLRGYIT